MAKQEKISLQVTDMMQKMINGFPSDTSPVFFEAYCSALLNMALLMIQLGDLDVATDGKGSLHVTARTAQGVRNLTVNVDFE